jgi:hypothetical protein
VKYYWILTLAMPGRHAGATYSGTSVIPPGASLGAEARELIHHHTASFRSDRGLGPREGNVVVEHFTFAPDS